MRRRPILIAAGLVVVAAAVAAATIATLRGTRPDPGCSDARWGCAEFEPDEPIVVGALLPTSGAAATLGRPALAAVQRTIDRADPVHGHDLVLDPQDDACRHDLASEAARRFGTSESPTRPPTAAAIGAICRPTVQPASQILSDTGVPLVSWYEDNLAFADPSPRTGFLVRIEMPPSNPAAPHSGAAEVAAAMVVQAIREVAVPLEDGALLVPRTPLRDELRRLSADPGSLVAPEAAT